MTSTDILVISEFADGEALSEVSASGLVEILPNKSLSFRPFLEGEYVSRIHSGGLRCRARNQAGTVLSRESRIKAGN